MLLGAAPKSDLEKLLGTSVQDLVGTPAKPAETPAAYTPLSDPDAEIARIMGDIAKNPDAGGPPAQDKGAEKAAAKAAEKQAAAEKAAEEKAAKEAAKKAAAEKAAEEKAAKEAEKKAAAEKAAEEKAAAKQ